MESHMQFEATRISRGQQKRYGKGTSSTAGKYNRQISPNGLAAIKLNTALSVYKEYTKDGRNNLQNEFIDMHNLRTMNMKVFAATLTFLKYFKNNITPDSFKNDNILPFIIPLLPSTFLSKKDKEILIIRFKSLILSYIKSIAIYREEE